MFILYMGSAELCWQVQLLLTEDDICKSLQEGHEERNKNTTTVKQLWDYKSKKRGKSLLNDALPCLLVSLVGYKQTGFPSVLFLHFFLFVLFWTQHRESRKYDVKLIVEPVVKSQPIYQ